jgi:hypothetical protein
VRRYAIGLQLVVLLCCAVASGYLWRAALETGRAIRYLSAGQPYEPSWPALGSAGGVAVAHVPTHKPAKPASGAKGAPARSRHAAPTSVARTAQLADASASPPANSAPPVAKVRHQTPPHGPTSAPPSPPAPSPPPPTLPPSPPPPSPPPPAAPTPAVSVAAGTIKRRDRPGWGYGDRNHDHTGPPAKSAESSRAPTPEPPEPAKPGKPDNPPTPAKAPEPPKASGPPEDHGHTKK